MQRREKTTDRDPSTGRLKAGHSRRWKPGRSGNPSGISGKQTDARGLAEDFGTLVNPNTGRTMDEHFIQLLYRRACQGNMRAAELWANYRWGKPVQYNVTAEFSAEGLREALEAGIKRVQASTEAAIPVPILEAENPAAAKAKAKPADSVPEVMQERDEAPRQPVIQREQEPRNIFDALNRPTRDPVQVGESFGSWRR